MKMKRIYLFVAAGLVLLFSCPIWAGWLSVLGGSPPAAGGGNSPGTTNLVAYYSLENATDAHTGGYNLTENGTPTYVAAKVANGWLKDAANEFLSLADNAAFEPGAGAWSVAFWVKLTDATPAADAGLVGKYNFISNQRSWVVNQKTDGQTRVVVSSNGAVTTLLSTTDARSDATWYHVVAVYVPSTSLKIYINGSLNNTNTTSIPASIHNSNASFKIGAWANDENLSSNGTYDEVAIYSKELSADNVTWLYNSGNGRAYVDL